MGILQQGKLKKSVLPRCTQVDRKTKWVICVNSTPNSISWFQQGNLEQKNIDSASVSLI